MLAKIKKFCKPRIENFLVRGKEREKDLILLIVIILVSLISFGFGRLSKIGESKIPINIERVSLDSESQEGNVVISQPNKLFVASKNGTKYHYPWCSGAQSIKEENKIWFSSKEEAEKAGYQPASNCKGLK